MGRTELDLAQGLRHKGNCSDQELSLLCPYCSVPDAKAAEDLAERLEEMRFPVFASLETAIKALGLAWKYAAARRGG